MTERLDDRGSDALRLGAEADLLVFDGLRPLELVEEERHDNLRAGRERGGVRRARAAVVDDARAAPHDGAVVHGPLDDEDLRVAAERLRRVAELVGLDDADAARGGERVPEAAVDGVRRFSRQAARGLRSRGAEGHEDAPAAALLLRRPLRRGVEKGLRGPRGAAAGVEPDVEEAAEDDGAGRPVARPREERLVDAVEHARRRPAAEEVLEAVGALRFAALDGRAVRQPAAHEERRPEPVLDVGEGEAPRFGGVHLALALLVAREPAAERRLAALEVAPPAAGRGARHRVALDDGAAQVQHVGEVDALEREEVEGERRRAPRRLQARGALLVAPESRRVRGARQARRRRHPAELELVQVLGLEPGAVRLVRDELDALRAVGTPVPGDVQHRLDVAARAEGEAAQELTHATRVNVSKRLEQLALRRQERLARECSSHFKKKCKVCASSLLTFAMR